MQTMYYVGLDVHNRTMSYPVKDASGTRLTPNALFPPHASGSIGEETTTAVDGGATNIYRRP